MNKYKIKIPEEDMLVISEGYVSPIDALQGKSSKIQYKLNRGEIHEKVQSHAFELGYEWGANRGYICNKDKPFLYMSEDGCLYWNDVSCDTFLYSTAQEISWQEFLELPIGNKLKAENITGIKIENLTNGPVTANISWNEIDEPPNYDDFIELMIENMTKTLDIPLDILKGKFNKQENKMKKITVATAKRDKDSALRSDNLIGVEKLEVYRGISQTEAAIEYTKKHKAVKTTDLVFIEEDELWHKFN